MKKMKGYRTMRFCFGWLARLLMPMRIRGKKNVPDAPYLVIANHTSLFDVVPLAVAFRQPMHFLAKKEVARNAPGRALVRVMQAIPIDREAADITAMRRVLEAFRDGENVAIFPQGTRRPGVDPATTEVKGGIGMFVSRAKVPVVPVALRTKKRKTKMFRRVEVVIGKPITADEYLDGIGRGEYDRITERLFDRVCALERGDAE